MKHKILGFLILTLATSGASASTTEVATRYLEHNLNDRAKEVFIEIATSQDSEPSDIATAIYQLGSIALNENNVEIAIKEWETLLSDYPEQASAYDIAGKLKIMGDIYGKSAERSLQNAIAQSYIQNGDFYTSEKSETTTIDTSWIPLIEASVGWYDRVIEEFPNTEEAKQAYLKKFAAYVGWRARGQYDQDYGIYSDFQINQALKNMENLIVEYEQMFPSDNNLQRMRFTIAQAYWNKKDWAKTREWLNVIIDNDDGINGFWKDVAEWRLKKVEY